MASAGTSRPPGGGTADAIGDIAAGLAAQVSMGREAGLLHGSHHSAPPLQAWLGPRAVSLASFSDRLTGRYYDASALRAASPSNTTVRRAAAAAPPPPAAEGATGWLLVYVLNSNVTNASVPAPPPPPSVVVQRIRAAFSAANASVFNATLGRTAARWAAGGGYGGFSAYGATIVLSPSNDTAAAAVAGDPDPALLAAWLAAGGDGGPYSPPVPASPSAPPPPALIASSDSYKVYAAVGGSLGLLLLCCCLWLLLVLCCCGARRRRHEERLAQKRRLDAEAGVVTVDHMAGPLALAAVHGAAAAHASRVAAAEAVAQADAEARARGQAQQAAAAQVAARPDTSRRGGVAGAIVATPPLSAGLRRPAQQQKQQLHRPSFSMAQYDAFAPASPLTPQAGGRRGAAAAAARGAGATTGRTAAVAVVGGGATVDVDDDAGVAALYAPVTDAGGAGGLHLEELPLQGGGGGAPPSSSTRTAGARSPELPLLLSPEVTLSAAGRARPLAAHPPMPPPRPPSLAVSTFPTVWVAGSSPLPVRGAGSGGTGAGSPPRGSGLAGQMSSGSPPPPASSESHEPLGPAALLQQHQPAPQAQAGPSRPRVPFRHVASHFVAAPPPPLPAQDYEL